LVAGGAGFIVVHLVNSFIEAGRKTIVVDDASGGFKDNVNRKDIFIKGSL